MPERPTLTRKERERRFKRREILRAALSVFADKGYEQATIEEIAERAEFSKGALYLYFANKKEMFRAILEDTLAQFEKTLDAAPPEGESVRERFRWLTAATLTFFRENPDNLSILINENIQVKVHTHPGLRGDFARKRAELVRRVAGMFDGAIARGEIREIDTLELVEVYWSILFTFMLHERLCGRDTPLDRITETILTIFLDGVLRR